MRRRWRSVLGGAFLLVAGACAGGGSAPPAATPAPYTGDPGHPQAGLVNDVILDFFDHYLRGDAGGLARLTARAQAPGVAKLELER